MFSNKFGGQQLEKSEQQHVKVIHLASWYPRREQPFLGNFVQQQIRALSRHTESIFLSKFPVRDEADFQTLTSPNPFYFSWLFFILKMLRRTDAEVLHLHVSRDLWFLGFLLKFVWKKPFLITEHGSYFSRDQYQRLNPIKRKGIRSLLKRSDQVVGVSRCLSQEIQASTGVSASIVGNFVADSWFENILYQRSFETYRFLHVSTLSEVKNPMGILNAALMCRQAGYHNFELTMVAETRNSEVENFIKAMKMETYVHLKEAMQHHEIKQEMERAHCFVLNSNYETFSIVSLEALVLGLQLITTPVGFMQDLDSPCLEKIEFNNTEALSAAMMKCISKQSFPGTEATALVEKYKETRFVQQYLAYYTDLKNGKN